MGNYYNERLLSTLNLYIILKFYNKHCQIIPFQSMEYTLLSS